MKQLTCEMCGSTDLIKQDGVFVCQSCGCKYSVEEAKKMMIEGTVEVTGTVKVDTSDEIENMITRAKQFEQENNDERALEYYNKVLDIDASNQFAKERIKALKSIMYIGNVKVSPAISQQIVTFMVKQQTLDAIKLVREISGLDYINAKTWVENYITNNLDKNQYIENQHNIDSSQSNNNASNKKSGGCYIATCVYGSYDCPQVWTLRRYRDDTLGATWYGRGFIRTYYAISPTLVKWFGKTKWFKNLWKGKLDRMVKKLQDNGVENTPYEDKEW